MEQARCLDDFIELGAGADALGSSQPVEVAPFRELVVDSVSFSHPASPVKALHSVALTLQAGEVVAIVGHNGSGKTTLAKLLSSLCEPPSGSTWPHRRPDLAPLLHCPVG